MTREDYINDEYNRALIHYQAMKALKDGLAASSTPEPTPEPTPVPAPEPAPAPVPTSDPVLVYNGQDHYTIAPGESVTVSVIAYNMTNTRDVYCSISNEPSVVRHKTLETKVNNGIRIDFVLTAANRGTSYLNAYLAKDKNNKDKWITVAVDVK